MSSVSIRDELMNLKSKMESLEEDLTKQLIDAEVKYKKWFEIDKEVDEMRKNQTDIITINVGGKLFQTKLDTLLSVKDTFFYKIVVSKRVDIQNELFIDRSYKFFKYILTYLRYQKVNISTLSTIDIEDLQEEANFYEVEGLATYIEEARRDVKYVSFEFNGPYTAGATAGTNLIEDLNNFEDRTAMKGICAISPGWIILEINREIEIEKIEVAGWGGNTGIWGASNGSSAQILTSIDKNIWTSVGSLPTNFSNAITTVNLTISRGKYLKFLSNSYLGIGYCRILKN